MPAGREWRKSENCHGASWPPDIKTTLQTYTFNTEVMQTTAVDIFESVAK